MLVPDCIVLFVAVLLLVQPVFGALNKGGGLFAEEGRLKRLGAFYKGRGVT
jgi:hypothetical protein